MNFPKVKPSDQLSNDRSENASITEIQYVDKSEIYIKNDETVTPGSLSIDRAGSKI